MPEYRSVSQLKQFEQCGLQFKLDRIDKAWNRPAAWFDHGTAVHSAVEAFEKSGRTMTLEAAQKLAVEEYSAGINRRLADTPNADVWFESGRYRGFDDIERRAEIVPEMVARYYDYVANNPDDCVIWVADDGTPGIELGFDIDLEGVRVRGYIDQVTDRGNTVHVRDIKTGSQPGDTFQLRVYALALEETYGVTCPTGDYWMGREGRPVPKRKPHDLTTVSRSEVVDRFHAADEGIRAERFEPNPGEHCRRCSVKTSCPLFDN